MKCNNMGKKSHDTLEKCLQRLQISSTLVLRMQMHAPHTRIVQPRQSVLSSLTQGDCIAVEATFSVTSRNTGQTDTASIHSCMSLPAMSGLVHD